MVLVVVCSGVLVVVVVGVARGWFGSRSAAEQLLTVHGTGTRSQQRFSGWSGELRLERWHPDPGGPPETSPALFEAPLQRSFEKWPVGKKG